jgi:hypothetical protein
MNHSLGVASITFEDEDAPHLFLSSHDDYLSFDEVERNRPEDLEVPLHPDGNP